MEPLFDFRGRVLPIGTGLTTNAIVDGLLRMHACNKHHAKPITIYVVGGIDAASISAVEVMLITGVMRIVRSPIRTVGLGILTGWQPLLLACGTAGQRYLMRQTLLSVAPPDWNHGLPKTVIGLHQSAHEPMHRQTERTLQQQHRELLAELKLPPDLFTTHQLLDSKTAVATGLADQVVERILNPEISPSRKPSSHKFLSHETQL
jgi:ATP-dependent protease ClpP protease subunit